MPKKIKNLYDQKLTFDKLLEAHKRAKKNKTYKKDVINYELNLENNIINLLRNLQKQNYHLGNYYKFKIFKLGYLAIRLSRIYGFRVSPPVPKIFKLDKSASSNLF